MTSLLHALLRFHLRRPKGLWIVVGILSLALAFGIARVERRLDLLSLLPSGHPQVRANLEAGVGQQELLWIVAEGSDADLEDRRAWADGVVERLLDKGGLPLNGLAAEGRLAQPVALPTTAGLSPWPALLALGAISDGDPAVGRLSTEALYGLAPAWLGNRLAPLKDPAELRHRIEASARALASPEPVEAALARLDPLDLRDLAPRGPEGLDRAQGLARALTFRLRTGYLETKDRRLVLLPLVAGFPTSDARATAQALAWIGRGADGDPRRASLAQAEAALAPAPDRAFPLHVTGAHAITAFENRHLTREVMVSLALSFVLIGLVYYLGFRTFAGFGFIMLPLLIGMLWALGLTGWVLGRLNLMAAGFGAVLMGVGDDVGILLFSRYRDERHRGAGKVRALRAALMGTGPGVVAGALSVAFAFLSLAFSPFPGLRDLGLTTGLGLLCCMVATFLVLPPLLLWRDKGRGTFAPRAETPRPAVRRPWKLLLALGLLALALLAAPKVRWEEDLRRFRAQGNPALQWQERLGQQLGASLQPLALQIPLDHPDLLPGRWNRLAPHLRDAGLPFPDWQHPDPELRLTLGSESWRRKVLEEAARAGMDPAALERPLAALAASLADPAVPVRALQEALPRPSPAADSDPHSLASLLFPAKAPEPLPPSLNLPLRLDERQQEALAPKVAEAGGRLVGTRPLFQVVKGIAKESIRDALLLTLGALLCTLALFGRSLRFAAFALLPLAGSLAGCFGLLGATGEPLTFLSLMALPIALGVSVDTAFNLLHRARQETRAADRVARVNAVCAGTTLAGFGGLVFSGYRGLRGLGLACLGGVALALLLTQWLLPAMLEKWPLKEGRDPR